MNHNIGADELEDYLIMMPQAMLKIHLPSLELCVDSENRKFLVRGP